MGGRAAAPRRLALLFLSAAAALAAPATAHGADRIYWSNFNSGNPARTIAYRNLDGSGGLNLSTAGATVDGAMGMALDPSHGRVYWTNWGADTGMGHGHGTTISYANLDGSGSGGDLPIAAAFVVGPHGLAIDPVAGKIYWPNFGDDDGVHETGEDTIASANLDGSGAAYVNTAGTSISGPRGVTLDPAAGRIYWANYGDGLGTTISYANLDGSGGADVVTMPGTATTEGPEGIALDVAAGRIYWGNYGPQPAGAGQGRHDRLHEPRRQRRLGRPRHVPDRSRPRPWRRDRPGGGRDLLAELRRQHARQGQPRRQRRQPDRRRHSGGEGLRTGAPDPAQQTARDRDALDRRQRGDRLDAQLRPGKLGTRPGHGAAVSGAPERQLRMDARRPERRGCHLEFDRGDCPWDLSLPRDRSQCRRRDESAQRPADDPGCG